MNPEIAAIRARLKATGASLSRLARASNVSKAYLSMLFREERGTCFVRPGVLERLKAGMARVEAQPVDPDRRRWTRRARAGFDSLAEKKLKQAARRRRVQKGRKP